MKKILFIIFLITIFGLNAEINSIKLPCYKLSPQLKELCKNIITQNKLQTNRLILSFHEIKNEKIIVITTETYSVSISDGINCLNNLKGYSMVDSTTVFINAKYTWEFIEPIKNNKLFYYNTDYIPYIDGVKEWIYLFYKNEFILINSKENGNASDKK